jgi:hypothetical protein
MGGAVGNMLGINNKYRAGEDAYNGAIDQSQQNNLTLQSSLMEQMNGGGPNLAQQQFTNATQQLQQQAASQIGGIKGISPAAQARLLAQQSSGIGQNLAGEAAAQRMQQQLAAQQQLGQQSMGMFDVASGRKLGAQQINAGVTAGNAANAAAVVGGGLNALGGAMSLPGSAPAASGYTAAQPFNPQAAGPGYAEGGVVGDDGPSSELGRALMGMTGGGTVPGTPTVPGDSAVNDTVPAALSPGEIVIPRSHAGSPEAAASFVQALQQRQGGGFQRVAQARMACGGQVGYADGGQVQDPGLIEKAKGYWAKLTQATPEDAGRKLPDALGGGFADLVAKRRLAADQAGN